MELPLCHARGGGDVIQPPSVVQSEQAEHGKEYAHPHAGRAIGIKGIEAIWFFPGAAGLHEGHRVNRGAGVGRQRVAQLETVLRDSWGARILIGGGQREVVISAEGDDFTAVEHVAAEENAAEVEALEELDREKEDETLKLATEAWEVIAARFRPHVARIRDNVKDLDALCKRRAIP